MTQFVYKDKYIQYRGYVFANGNPVSIKDEATDRLLRLHPDFKIFEPVVHIEPEVQVFEEVTVVVPETMYSKLETLITKKKPGRPFKVT